MQHHALRAGAAGGGRLRQGWIDGKLQVAVEASYLHGGPANGLPVRMSARIVPHQYANPDFPNHVFEPKSSHRETQAASNRTLDETGRLEASFDRPEEPGTWLARVTSSVRERGGRANSRTIWTVLDNGGEHLGIDLPAGRLHRPGVPVRADLVPIDAAGTVDPVRPVETELLAVEHEWMLHEVDGDYRWRSEERTRP